MTSIPTALVEPYRNYHKAADQVHETRLAVYAAESALEDAKDALNVEESRLQLIATGRNAEERKAAHVLLMSEDVEYREARRNAAQARQALAQAQADLEREIDRKRGWGWLIRAAAGINAPPADEA